MDPGTRGPCIDLALRTSAPGVFAVGNLVHAAETADVAALTGRAVVGPLKDYLMSGQWSQGLVAPIECDDPIAWVSPNAI
jgi:hypothetical protein